MWFRYSQEKMAEVFAKSGEDPDQMLHQGQMSQFCRWLFKNIFLIFPENGLWKLMQIVPLEDNLHEISKIIFCGKKEKYCQLSSAN